MMTLGDRIEKEILEKAEIEFSIRAKRIEVETQQKARKEARKNTLRLKEQCALRLIDKGLDITTIVHCVELSPEAVERLSQKRRDR